MKRHVLDLDYDPATFTAEDIRQLRLLSETMFEQNPHLFNWVIGVLDEEERRRQTAPQAFAVAPRVPALEWTPHQIARALLGALSMRNTPMADGAAAFAKALAF